MANKEADRAGVVIKPCGRAFFVYYVAIAIFLLGPRLNPEVWIFGVFHFSQAVGTGLGLLVLALVVYMKLGPGVPHHPPGRDAGLALALTPAARDHLGEPGGGPGAPGAHPDDPAGGQSHHQG